MRIQIVNSETGEVVFIPTANRHLETEFHSFLDERAAGLRWWNPLKKRHVAHAKRVFDDAARELRELSAHA